MSLELSVIICAHNPRPEYLSRVLQGLKEQTLEYGNWELLLIDNASESPLAQLYDLTWHSHARHIREDSLGLTKARLAGIRESVSGLLVFVDDDNVLAGDFLRAAIAISEKWPTLGVWGGQVIGEFQEEPPEWSQPYLCYLALYQRETDQWSNLPMNETTPVGAGMCVRRIVADQYALKVLNDRRRLALGRTGNSLMGGEDYDIACTACDMGLGCGRFTSLKLTHLIPSGRLKENYLVNLVRDSTYSMMLLRGIRGESLPPRRSIANKVVHMLIRARRSRRERRFFDAVEHGRVAAINKLSQGGVLAAGGEANSALTEQPE